jgi:hypothetical protein
MKSDRELIQLAKSQTLEAIADQLQRSPAFVLKRAAIWRKERRIGVIFQEAHF